ncbi:MAG: ABC transporter permease [Lachnospiraceae bacterium]|jgi:hypothetical protein|uniref:ABC transporter permease n=1 Tax=Candidatus Merdisoma sp. JLR.KK006 TaxID=3112626 RepID=UPI002FF22843|nr:ABC transporter permease [Lachnospiraceae bacterium]
MIKYELKKVFLRTGSRIALLVLLLVTGITCFFAANISYVNENGESTSGPAAIAALKNAQKEWSGFLDEETLRQVIAENRRIRTSPEAISDNVRESNIAYSWGQGIGEIRSLLNCSFCAFREYDYYRADSLTEDEASSFYANRISSLKDWLSDEAKDQFSEKEKEYLIGQYESLETPFFWDYMAGWRQLFEYAPTVVMITMLVLGYLVAGIFSSEFSWKSDAIFFTSFYGRDRAVFAKVKAGFLLVTAVYFTAFLLYTGMVLTYLGADGFNCAIQSSWGSWKSFYNITNWQEFLLIALGGYIGCLFISSLSMLVSAKTKSAVIAVMVPVVLIFIPSFIGNINSPLINKILGLLPDQLLQAGVALDYFNLYTVGGHVIGAVPVILVLYAVLTVVLMPVLYQEYRRKQIS